MSCSQWVLLWSKRQNCFHIEPAQELVRKNAAAMHGDKTLNDYHPVFMGTRDQCNAQAESSRHLLMERDRYVA